MEDEEERCTLARFQRESKRFPLATCLALVQMAIILKYEQ